MPRRDEKGWPGGTRTPTGMLLSGGGTRAILVPLAKMLVPTRGGVGRLGRHPCWPLPPRRGWHLWARKREHPEVMRKR